MGLVQVGQMGQMGQMGHAAHWSTDSMDLLEAWPAWAALAEVSGWLGFLPVEAVTATEVVAMKLPGQGCLEDLAKSATATTSKKSARTEGAEAFFVGTHDPEAIAIAIKL